MADCCGICSIIDDISLTTYRDHTHYDLCRCKILYHAHCLEDWFKVAFAHICPVCRTKSPIPPTDRMDYFRCIIDDIIEKHTTLANYYLLKIINTNVNSKNSLIYYSHGCLLIVLSLFLIVVSNCIIIPYLVYKIILYNVIVWFNRLRQMYETG